MADERDTADETPTASAATWDPADTPKQIGQYTILEQIGEGGMGVVYVAEQQEPVRRRVALKIIKLGMDTKQVIARFEAERQALAMMDHPNVARVFDAGATETGRPYFVMEHVAGVAITEHCDKQRLAIDDRLQLFMQVCEAVQHAHQKGIIHRDLKPSNILVTATTSAPKVIDFGVAKALHQRLTKQTLFTEQGQLIGTPEYMSPEQAEMTAEDIDTRSDIYSLGVLLYELLTGERPFSSETLRQAGLAEIQRIIREEDPPKPSTRLSSLGDATATHAHSRRADPRTLSRSLRGDLDWIVMKALEKDRARRYETADGLAADLRRHLAHAPVQARPPSATYVMRTLVRRHRAFAVGTAAVLLILVAGIVATAGQAVRANRALERAERESSIATAVNDFLNKDLLASVAPSPDAGRGRDVTMREVLDRAAETIEVASGPDGRFGDKPLVEASIRATLGLTYFALGEYPDAEPHLKRAHLLHQRELGETHTQTLASLNDLGVLYRHQGRYAEAEPLLLATLEMRRGRLGDAHPDTLDSMNNLAVLRWDLGRYAEAEPLLLTALDIRKRQLGPEHPRTVHSIINLANLYQAVRRYAEAEALYLEALGVTERVHGPEHADTLLAANNLAVVYLDQGRHAEAEPLLVETLERTRREIGPEHPQSLRSMFNLAIVRQALGRPDEAEELYLETLDLQEQVLGADHAETLKTMMELGILYYTLERFDDAQRLWVETLTTRRRVLGDDHRDTLLVMNNVAELSREQGRVDEAADLFAEAVSRGRRALDDSDWLTGVLIGAYGKTLAALGRFEEAEAHLVEAFEMISARLGRNDARVFEQIDALVDLCDARGDQDGAAEWRATAERIRASVN